MLQPRLRLALLGLCSLAAFTPAQGQGFYPPTYPPPAYPGPPPPPMGVGMPICTNLDGCLLVEQSNTTFPDVSFEVRAEGFELPGAPDDQLEYTFGFLKVDNSTVAVPEEAQPLVSTSNARFVTSPKGPSPNRTLVAPNGPGMYEAYVCAVNSMGEEDCSSAMVTVLAPCPNVALVIEGVEELDIELTLGAALAGGDPNGILEAAFTLAAVLNTLGRAPTTGLMRLMAEPELGNLYEAIFNALNEILTFTGSDSSTAAAVLNAQQALLTRVDPITKPEPSVCDVDPICPRGPQFWKNNPQVWDANGNNDASFAGKRGYPASDILLPPFSRDRLDILSWGFLVIGDTNRNGVPELRDDVVLLVSLQEAREALSSGRDEDEDEDEGNGPGNGRGNGRGNERGNGRGGGRGRGNGRKLLQGRGMNDKKPALKRALITAWLNWLAYARPQPPQSLIQEAILWLRLYDDRKVEQNSFAWIGCDGNGIVRCGIQIKRDLEETYENGCGGLENGDNGMDDGMAETLAKQCLENVNFALAYFATSPMYDLSTMTAGSAIDSAYGCSRTLIFVKGVPDYPIVQVIEATLQVVGFRLGMQAPPELTLPAEGLEAPVTLGVSANIGDSMADASVALPELVISGTGAGNPIAKFPNATWCVSDRGACASQSPLIVRVVWSELPSMSFESIIEEYVGAEEGASDFKIVSGVLQVQPNGIAGQPYDGAPNATMTCEGDIDESDCAIRLGIPFVSNLLVFDPRRNIACARLVPTSSSTLIAIIGDRIEVEYVNPNPVICTSSYWGAHVLVEYEREFENDGTLIP